MRSKSISAIFPVAFIFSFCWLHSLCVTFWSSSHYFKLFLLFYLLQWSVIFAVAVVIVLGYHQPCTWKIINLIGKMLFVFWLLQWPVAPPSLSLSSSLSVPWENNTEVRLIILQWPQSVQVTGWVTHLSTLNQKLDTTELSEESVLNLVMGWKLGLLSNSQVVNERKSSWRILEVLLHWTHEC